MALSNIIDKSLTVQCHGLQYSNFAILQSPASVPDNITVTGIEDGPFSGLSFSISGETMSVGGGDTQKELVLFYTVANSANENKISAARLGIEASVSGSGFSGAGISLSDKSPAPLATSLSSASVGVSIHLPPDDSRTVEVLRTPIDVVGVGADFFTSSIVATDSARIASVQHLFAVEKHRTAR